MIGVDPVAARAFEVPEVPFINPKSLSVVIDGAIPITKLNVAVSDP